FIDQDKNERLHAYLSGVLKQLDSPALIINSVSDHVHTLFRLSKNHALSKVVEEVKKESSKWFKEKDGVNDKFSWQIGYAAYSVSSSKVDIVRHYILRQQEHHKIQTFKEEVEEFMKRYDVLDYDERYFWR
ncbi:MAG: transposase, partial [Marinilabiliaceae bacterium]|nr:transposase [Marinilabiliaceae bacterium]